MNAVSEFLYRLPKAEVHCHFVGAIPADVAWRIATRNEVALPATSAADLYVYDNFHDFIERYMRIATAFRKPSDFAEAMYAILDDGLRHGNVQYREVFFNPTDHYSGGLSYAEMLAGLVEGITAAETDLGVRCRLIPSINRMESAQVALGLVEEVAAHRRDEVIGIGLDAAEPAGPPERFVEAFQLAGRSGLRRTAHACEDYAGLDGGPPANAIACLDELGCDRLDHGYNILADPTVVSRCRESGVPFTVCLPGSNPALRADRVASIRSMMAAGLPVSLHSDDPTMHRTTPGEVYQLGAGSLGLDTSAMAELALAALDAAWLDDGERHELRAAFQHETAALAAELF
ncbi:adenosine deaminase [Ruania zhangjianzhongii]|uniref:adenosine deaminase n=1 Tax=Ruania zhangjianzhongii TaxID=2603206 RepID=UPI00143DBB92|nr:adenosine deaminase [Ruania zhangjianzhongii]